MIQEQSESRWKINQFRKFSNHLKHNMVPNLSQANTGKLVNL